MGGQGKSYIGQTVQKSTVYTAVLVKVLRCDGGLYRGLPSCYFYYLDPQQLAKGVMGGHAGSSLGARMPR